MQSIVIIAIQFFPSGTCMHIRSQPVNMRNSQNYHFVSSGMKSMAKLQTKLVINNKFKAIRGFSLPSFFVGFRRPGWSHGVEMMKNTGFDMKDRILMKLDTITLPRQTT